ncbi:MAG: hypothetical protein IKK84_00230 [Clostridia bacterium]|nr:hypothetical protein [Clostridia bacterium]
MKLYNFDRLIEKYSSEFRLIKKTGQYVSGEWQETETIGITRGAILPVSSSEVYSSGGTLSTSDRHLYRKKPIVEPTDGQTMDEALKLIEIEKDGKRFKISQDQDYSDFGDVYVYVLKGASNYDNTKRA